MLISVVIPTFNCAHFLGPLLARLSAEKYVELEVIVVDDGSTDTTCELLTQFNVKVVRQNNMGPSCARNAGLSQAKGGLVHFQDADDLPDLDFYEVLSEPFRDSSIQMATANARLIGEKGEVLTADWYNSNSWSFFLRPRAFPLSLAELRDLLLRKSVVSTSGTLYRRSSIITKWNPKIRVGEDRLFALQNIPKSPGSAWIQPQPMWSYRLHPGNHYAAHSRLDKIAYRDICCLREILRTSELAPNQHEYLLSCIARNYFDWAWHCRKLGQRKSAGVLLKAAWRLAPNWKVLRARIVNRLSVG